MSVRVGQLRLVAICAAVLLAAMAVAVRIPAGAAPASMSPASGAPTAASAPEFRFPVGIRALALKRRADRPLPTVVWYPASGAGSRDAPVAAGRFPIVVFSHGLRGRPEQYRALTAHWAAAGFVVVAPTYPHTHRDAPRFDRDDVVHQPADAAFVLQAVAALDARRGDPFHQRLDTSRACATGYSAGGFTTSGMLTAKRDRRLRCGIVIAGGRIDGGFTGPPVPVLFIHGDADRTVTLSRGRSAYDRLDWPKAFLTLPGADHGVFLSPSGRGHEPLLRVSTDFLRWVLYDDSAARDRLAADAAPATFATTL